MCKSISSLRYVKIFRLLLPQNSSHLVFLYNRVLTAVRESASAERTTEAWFGKVRSGGLSPNVSCCNLFKALTVNLCSRSQLSRVITALRLDSYVGLPVLTFYQR